MWYFSDEKLETIYNYAILAGWDWENLSEFADKEGLDLTELSDALAFEIDAEGYDQDKDLETGCPWCCPWEWGTSEKVIPLADFAEKYSPEIERLIKEEREENEED